MDAKSRNTLQSSPVYMKAVSNPATALG